MWTLGFKPILRLECEKGENWLFNQRFDFLFICTDSRIQIYINLMNNEQCWSLLLHRNLKNIPRKYSESFLINGLITPKVNQIQLVTNIVFHFWQWSFKVRFAAREFGVGQSDQAERARRLIHIQFEYAWQCSTLNIHIGKGKQFR